MWPRQVEILLGVWLALIPTVFGAPSAIAFWTIVLVGTAVVAFGVAAWAGFAAARFLTLGASIVAAGAVYAFAGYPASGFEQGVFLTAVLLAMFAIIPNRCNRPPDEWRRPNPDAGTATSPSPPKAS